MVNSEIFVLTLISSRESVACVQYFIAIQYFMSLCSDVNHSYGRCGLWSTVLYEIFVFTSISCREGVPCIKYFIVIQCFMQSLF